MKTIRDLKIGDIFEDGIVYNIEDNAIEIVSIICRLLYRNQIDISDIWQIPTISDFNKLLSKNILNNINAVYKNVNRRGINPHWIYLVKDNVDYAKDIIHYQDLGIIDANIMGVSTYTRRIPTFLIRSIKLKNEDENS